MANQLPYPHEKQRQMMLSPARFKCLVWGRRCFTADTLVAVPGGYSRIDNIKPGDKVISAEFGGRLVESEVVTNRYYGVDQYPKPMLRFRANEQTITTTYDHEFFSHGRFVPVYQLAWGAMDASQREKLELLCLEYGKITDDQLERWKTDISDETSKRLLGILENSGRRKDDKNTPFSGGDLDTEPTKQASSESYKRSEGRQSDRELGVGDSPREHRPLREDGSSGEELWREVRDEQVDGKGSQGNPALQRESSTINQNGDGKKTLKQVRDKDGQHTGYSQGQDLEISSVEVLGSLPTYDIQVADNKNFLITEQNILVHNSGKSLGIALYTMLKALQKPGNYYIIAPTYTQAKSIYWNDILKVLIPGAIVNDTNESELFVEFQPLHYKLETKAILGYDIDSDHTGISTPSRVYLKGANNPDSLRGVSLSGAVLDEFAFFQYANDTWRKIIRPALADNLGWAIFSSTPDGVHNSFFDVVETAKLRMTEAPNQWFYSHATMLDNTSLPHRKQEWEDTKAEYIRDGKIDEWVQEWEAKFTTPNSLVYNEFDDEKHVINPNLIPRDNVTYAIGMDFGLKDPFAAVFVVIDKNDNWYIYDEIYLPDLPVDKIASVLHTKMGDQYFTRIIGDSAGATEIASLKSKALGDQRVWVTPAKKGKDSIRGGIRQVKTKLYVREATGKPKLFVGRNCKATIKEFQSYKRLRDAWGEVSETPEDKNNHLMDSLRYLVLDQMSGAKPIPKAKKKYSSSGRLIS